MLLFSIIAVTHAQELVPETCTDAWHCMWPKLCQSVWLDWSAVFERCTK